MNIRQLIARAKRITDPGDSYTDSDLLALVNEGVQEICLRVRFPGLQASVDLVATTTQDYVLLPTNFDVDVHHVMDVATGNAVAVWPNLRALMKLDLAESGYIYDAAVSMDVVEAGGSVRGRLVYRPRPLDDQTLRVFYYTAPPTFTTASTDADTAFLGHGWVEQLLLPYLCWKLFEEVHQDDPGRGDADRWKAVYDAKLEDAKAAFFTQPRYITTLDRRVGDF